MQPVEKDQKDKVVPSSAGFFIAMTSNVTKKIAAKTSESAGTMLDKRSTRKNVFRTP